MKVVGLFAGVGGIERGLEQAGHDTAMLCESDKAARRVLEYRFVSRRRTRRVCSIVDDVAGLTELPPDADLVTAGFPCQDLSQVGKTAGIDGEWTVPPPQASAALAAVVAGLADTLRCAVIHYIDTIERERGGSAW